MPGYLRSPSYGGISEFGPHLPLPEPPALPIELESVNNSESDDEAECPNMTLYSTTSMNLANNVQDIPIPDTAYPAAGSEFLDLIPIPSAAAPSEDIPLPEVGALKEPPLPASELYSPGKDDSDADSSDVEEILSDGSARCEKVAKRRASAHSSSDEAEPSSDDEKVAPPRKSHTPEKETPADESSQDVEIVKSDAEVSETSVEDPVDKDAPVSAQVSETTDELEKCSIDEVVASDDAKADDLEDGEKDIEEDDVASADDEAEEDAVTSEHEDPETGDKDDSAEPKPTDESEPQVIDDEEDEAEGTKDDTPVDVGSATVTAPASRKTSAEEGDEEANEIEDTEAPKDDDALEPAKANSTDVSTSNAYLLPSEDLDPVSDVEYNDFPDYHKQQSKERRKKRKRMRKRESSVEPAATKAENRELEEGEIEEDRTKKKHAAPRKRRTSDSEERPEDKKQKRRRDRKDKGGAGKENKESTSSKNADTDLTWKKLSKNTKVRNYRDGKAKPDRLVDRNRERESIKKKEKRKEIERYDVRKIVSDKPRTIRDEFGRDVSVPRTRSRSLSPARSYSSRRRSKGPLRRSFSQDDRWIDWSPLWTQQRRSRSRTRRSKSRSRNRSRHSGDRYGNRSKGRGNRDQHHEKQPRESRKRRRSLSSVERYSSDERKRKRSKERGGAHRAGSYGNTRAGREHPPDYFYERSWSPSPSYASLSPEPSAYVSRYERSPSIIEPPPSRIPVVSPEPGMLSPNPTLTVIVPNVDATKKKHKKKKDGKKKKKKQQPSKEVFTSGDNIVVSVNFDDNQKIISAKSSKRKHGSGGDEEKSRKKKKDVESSRKKRKQMLQVSDEVLNAKPVAVIDLNSSPCKEMSPTEVISLTDSGDETAANEIAAPADRREGYQTNENAVKSPEQRRAYVMTSSGPKTPPEPPIKFTVTSTTPCRPLPTNPIFEQDEELEREEDSMGHYNKGPNTPPEPANQTPNATMYDPFEPTKSRSQTPERVEIYEEHKDGAAEGRPTVIDMFSEDGEKPSDSQSATEKSKSQEDNKDGPAATATTSVAEEPLAAPKPSPAKDAIASETSNEQAQTNGLNTLVLDLSSLGDEFVPKSSIPLVKTSQGKYEFQGGKAPDKPITVVISQQTTPVKPLPQQVMVTPTRQIPTKPVEPIKQPIFPDILPWKLPPPLSQASFATPPPAVSTVTPTTLVPSAKSTAAAAAAAAALTQNGSQDESAFELDDSPYSPASSEDDDLFEPPPLNASAASPKSRPAPIPAVNSYKSRVDALFSSSPIKKMPPRPVAHPKPVSAIKGSKKVSKTGMSK